MSEHPAALEPTPEPTLHIDRWEGLWIRITLIIIVIFVAAITVAAVAFNIQLPGAVGRVDPNALDAPGSPFANPGVRELAPGKYEAYVVAQAWSFTPNPIVVPVGSEVTFYVTSRDIQHGFKIVDTNINMMVLPGQISSLTAVFDKPGVHNIICHEYCGIAHQTMYGQLMVVLPEGMHQSLLPTQTVTSSVTTPITGTAPLTATAPLTEAAPATGTAPLTATLPVTAASALTEAAAVETVVADAAALTGTAAFTAAAGLTTTGDVTVTESVTP